MSADAPVTREECDRVRAETIVGPASFASNVPLGILDRLLSQAADYPAALERARAEERERIDDMLTGLDVDPLKAAPEAHVGDFYAGVDAGINAALDAIRALGPRPSPEAEAPQPTAWLVYDENDDPAHIAHSPEEAAAIVDRLGGAMVHPVFIHPPTTPPAMTPDLRERVRKVLEPFATWLHDAERWASERGHGTSDDDVAIFGLGDLRAAAALLSDLAPAAQPEPSKKAMP